MIFDYLLTFFSGSILINSLPHLMWGMSGRYFPNHSEEERKNLPSLILLMSTPLFNAVWGLVNLLGGLAVLTVLEFQLRFDMQGLFLALGMTATVLILCIKMSQVHSDK